MRDVAARAGVTPTVVSRVLHNKANGIRVSQATAERVREAARVLGYRVNVMARNFRERQTMMIGVLHGVGFDRPKMGVGSRYFGQLMDGLIDGAFRHGYAVTLCPKLMGQTPEDAMSDGRFDGLVWYSTIPSETNQAMLRGCTSPLVMVHSQVENFTGRFPIVTCDNEQGIRLAVDHLVELGHRKIAFVREEEMAFSESTLRQEAFVRHMRKYGLTVGAGDIVDGGAGYGVDAYYSDGLRHTAVIAHTEELGGRFVRKAPRYGISIPDDLSVVGFDSTSYCEEFRPRLTSIYQPLKQLGERAIDLLVARIASDDDYAPCETIPCGLDMRESTAPPSSRSDG